MHHLLQSQFTPPNFLTQKHVPRHLAVGPRWVSVGMQQNRSGTRRKRESVILSVSATENNSTYSYTQQINYYAVLGVSPSASLSDIKKAYRLLARKWHPDVKDSLADEVFKNIHHAYQVLSDEATRKQYDRELNSREHGSEAFRRNRYEFDFKDEKCIYRGSKPIGMRRRKDGGRHYYGESFSFHVQPVGLCICEGQTLRLIKRDRFGGEHYYGESFSFHVRPEKKPEHDTVEVDREFSVHLEPDEKPKDDTLVDYRGSFFEFLLPSVLFRIFVPVVGYRFPLFFSLLSVTSDKKLDPGYQVGHLIALIRGGQAGIMLSLCLTFSSWFYGKISSGKVSLLLVALWVGSNISRYVYIPQGVLLAVLYHMSVKLRLS